MFLSLGAQQCRNLSEHLDCKKTRKRNEEPLPQRRALYLQIQVANFDETLNAHVVRLDDDGRVMLHDVDGMHALENDYINATYINVRNFVP